MNFQELFEQAQVPKDLGDKVETLQKIHLVERRGSIVSALILASAYEQNFEKDGNRFLAWAKREAGLAESEFWHRFAVGKLLLAFRDHAVIFRRMYDSTVDKLLPLTTLMKEKGLEAVAAFISYYPDIWSWDRQTMRDQVKAYLRKLKGLPVEEKRFDFAAFLKRFDFSMEDFDQEQNLTEESADKALVLGAGMLEMWMKHRAKNPRSEQVATVKQMLLQMAAGLERGVLSDPASRSYAVASGSDRESDRVIEEETKVENELAEYAGECGDHTAQTDYDKDGNCGNHSEFEPGTDCGNHSECCGNHTPCDCGNHSETECGNCGNHRESYDFSAIFGGFAGGCQGQSGGTFALPAESFGDEADEQYSDGSASGDGDSDQMATFVSDFDGIRTAGEVTADIQQLQELEGTAQGDHGSGETAACAC